MVRPTEAWLSQHPEWRGLKTVGMVYGERRVGEGEATGEARYFISSLGPRVGEFADAVRNHWATESNLHRFPDVGFRRDENRSRKDHTAENPARVRRLSASLLTKAGAELGVTCERKMAGWADDFLLEVAGPALA